MVGRIQLSEIKKVDGGVGWGKTPTKPQIQRPICAALLLPLSITIYGIRNRTMRRTIIENSSSSSSSSRSVENIFPSFYSFFCPLFFFFCSSNINNPAYATDRRTFEDSRPKSDQPAISGRDQQMSLDRRKNGGDGDGEAVLLICHCWRQ